MADLSLSTRAHSRFSYAHIGQSAPARQAVALWSFQSTCTITLILVATALKSSVRWPQNVRLRETNPVKIAPATSRRPRLVSKSAHAWASDSKRALASRQRRLPRALDPALGAVVERPVPDSRRSSATTLQIHASP